MEFQRILRGTFEKIDIRCPERVSPAACRFCARIQSAKRSIYNRQAVHSKVVVDILLVDPLGGATVATEEEFEIDDFKCRVLVLVSAGLTILSLSLFLFLSHSRLISLFLRHAVLIDEHRQSSREDSVLDLHIYTHTYAHCSGASQYSFALAWTD